MTFSKLINTFCSVFFLLLFLSIQFSCNKKVYTTPTINNDVIEFSGDLVEGFEENVADFYEHLGMIMDKKVLAQLKIKLTNNRDLVANQIVKKIGKKRQPFYIKVENDQIFIYGDHSEGLRNGMYWYLQELGFRWYFPGDLWRKIPNRQRNLKNVDKVVIPDFSNRSFSGGGGFPNRHPGDPSNIVRTEWTKWKHRNLFGEEVQGGGHAWQDFVKRNKEVLFKHPEYLAEKLDAKKPNFRTKLCVGNEGLVQLFIADRKKKLEESISRYGVTHLKAQSISVEPSDGGGHCKCRKCTKIGTVSDQVFYLANRVADAFQKKYPSVKVSLLAYNEHSAVPSIDLHKNLFVTIVPYGFQHETMPEAFVENWSKKTDNLQSYHYWGLLISRKGKPVENFLRRPVEELKLLQKYKVSGIRLETTYSIGAAGIPLYLLSKIAFDATSNVTQLADELMTDCFGEGKDIMSRIFQRWSDHDFIPQIERRVLEAEFNTAINAAKLDQEKQRIEAFKKYATFLLYADDVEDAKKNKQKLTQELDNLTDYSWSILPDLMIHSFWISSPFMRTYDVKRYKDNYRKKERERGLTYWANLKKKKFSSPFKNSNKIFLNDNTSLMLETQTSYSKIKERLSAVTRNQQRSAILIKPSKSFSLDYYAERSHELPFSFSSKVVNPNRFGTGVIIGLYQDERLIWTKTYKGATEKQRDVLSFPRKGHYTVKVKLPNVKMDLRWEDTEHTFLKCATPIKVPAYYYEPETIKDELIFVAKGKVMVYDEKGNKLPLLTVDKNVYKINLRNKNVKEIKFVSSLIVDILNTENCLFYLK